MPLLQKTLALTPSPALKVVPLCLPPILIGNPRLQRLDPDLPARKGVELQEVVGGVEFYYFLSTVQNYYLGDGLKFEFLFKHI